MPKWHAIAAKLRVSQGDRAHSVAEDPGVQHQGVWCSGGKWNAAAGVTGAPEEGHAASGVHGPCWCSSS